MTVDELLAELGVTVDPAKASVVKTWNEKFSALESEAQTKLTDAEKSLADAQALQRVIDENIRTSGLTETNVAAKDAVIASLNEAVAQRDAALKELKSKGFTGLDIPEFKPVSTTLEKDPVKALEDRLNSLANNMEAALRVQTNYFSIFEKPLPIDPGTLASEAVAARMPIEQYAEQKFQMSAERAKRATAAAQKEKDDYAAKKLEEYKAAHPVTAGHPELGPGVPSNYPNIPKPSDANGVREMSGKSPMEKIRMARDRVSKEVQSRLAVA